MGVCVTKKKQIQIAQEPIGLLDVIVDMKMAAKGFLSQASQAEKEKNKEIQKARKALKENNEEAAKLYLQNAATKQQISTQQLKLAHKLEAHAAVLKNSTNSKEMTEKISNLTPFLNTQSQQFSPEALMIKLEDFQKNIDMVNIQSELMNQLLHHGQYDTQLGIDQMMNNLQKEIQNEIEMELNPNPLQLK